MPFRPPDFFTAGVANMAQAPTTKKQAPPGLTGGAFELSREGFRD
jgi:hypothetical protein